MKKLLFLSLVVLAGCRGLPRRGEPLLREPQINPSSCLSQQIIDQRLAVLKDIPKPIDAVTTGEKDPATGEYVCNDSTTCNIDPDGTESPGWISCVNAPKRGCGDNPTTPEKSDYILVASQVKIPQIILGNRYPSDRQIVKQLFPDGDPLKDKIYRPFCGDWCYAGSGAEGFRGTFYCDFALHLTSDYDPNDPDKHHPLNPNLPPDGSVFDVYLREGAPIPDKVKCQNDGNGNQTTNLKDFINGLFDVAAQDNNQAIIQFENERWIYVGRENSVKTKDISPEPPRNLRGSVAFEGQDYDVYENLFANFGPDFIYLTTPGEVDQAYADYLSDPDNPAYASRLITYKEFQKASETKPRRGLQLGTFLVPVAATWVRDWIQESKPAIYLYPDEPTRLVVKLAPRGQITTSVPSYSPGGWQMTALPDGIISVDGKDYRYLYYEAHLDKDLVRAMVEPNQGFVVPGDQLETFFTPTLDRLGLSKQEAADFITYWQSRLDPAQSYFIHFLSFNEIETLEPLELTTRPQTSIRIRAYFKPVPPRTQVTRQKLPEPPKRRGFTLVEWGGILDD
jgi:hypothetical protein